MADTLRAREIVLIGGSGGLGSATAHTLAAEGAHLVVTYRADAERAAALASIATILRADVTSAGDRTSALDRAPNLYGLVVFAGDPSRVSDPAVMEQTMRRSYEVNCLGPLMAAREAAVRMKGQGAAGAIVLVSTMQAVALFPGSSAYAAPKSALIHGARILAKEYRADNVRVNVIAPGVMQAGMALPSIASGKYNSYLENHVIARFGRAEDVAGAVRFLLAPDNYVTGQVLSVDGGITL
jgi:NAD(P)-dependent dehydrogenase (short-subunit alcohol dehydrogenase family)